MSVCKACKKGIIVEICDGQIPPVCPVCGSVEIKGTGEVADGLSVCDNCPHEMYCDESGEKCNAYKAFLRVKLETLEGIEKALPKEKERIYNPTAKGIDRRMQGYNEAIGEVKSIIAKAKEALK